MQLQIAKSTLFVTLLFKTVDLAIDFSMHNTEKYER